jgi:transmembrane sensor
MGETPIAPNTGPQSYEAAAEWWLRLESDPVLARSQAFMDWNAIPENAAALQHVESAMAALREGGSTPTIVKMRTAALATLGRIGPAPGLLRRDFLAWGAAGAAATIGLAIGVPKWLGGTDDKSYSTEVTERRNIQLSDGSRVTLDSNSAISVNFRADGRLVNLDRGRARFDVVHDVDRPFEVTLGRETVVATGTSFDVERLSEKVLVTLIQGQVMVRNGPNEAEKKSEFRPVTVLKPGEQLVAGAGGIAVRNVNLLTETAWEEGRLVFRGQPLADAVERVNRYTNRRIEVAPAAAAVPISGVFNAGDTDAFISAVTAYLPVTASMNSDGTILLRQLT